jgi:hypothetical protein
MAITRKSRFHSGFFLSSELDSAACGRDTPDACAEDAQRLSQAYSN